MKDYKMWMLVGLAVVATLLLDNSRCNDLDVITVTDTIEKVRYSVDLRVDTVIEPKYIPISIHDTIYLRDTVMVHDTVVKYITDYLSKKVYKDTLLNDDRGLIALEDTIYKNSILSRKHTIMLNEVKEVERGIWIGGNINVNRIEVDVMYQKGKNMYGVGINTDIKVELKYKYRLWK